MNYIFLIFNFFVIIFRDMIRLTYIWCLFRPRPPSLWSHSWHWSASFRRASYSGTLGSAFCCSSCCRINCYDDADVCIASCFNLLLYSKWLSGLNLQRQLNSLTLQNGNQWMRMKCGILIIIENELLVI